MAAAVVAVVAMAVVIVGVGRDLAAAVAAAANYRLVYSYGSLYSANTYQYA